MSVSQDQRKRKNDGGQNIKVFIRIRPMSLSEKAARTFSCVHCQGNKEVVVQERQIDKYSKKFSFDKVFSETSKQEDIYRSVAKPLVEEVLNGYNCTIFAYGQTGTGKTFTMEGDHVNVNTSIEENEYAGIVPRSVNYLFDELRRHELEFTMRVSFLELYNEELFDLLSANGDLTKLRLYEDSARKGSCIIQGLEEVLVRSQTDVYSIIKKGSEKRQTAATLMNATSSRSHTVFTVTVHIKETTADGNEMLKTGKLHLVDLAGSENIGRSGAVDKRAREAGNINQSLLTVGRVITSLVEKAPHIPYRESKLTRLLQDALGGRTKTSIIATVSPASINLEETLSTLDYAHRAKNIQNRPEVNQKLNKKELITEYSAEIDRLQRDLLATREKNGVYLAHENYQDMTTTIEQQSKELLDKINFIRVIEEEQEKLKETFQDVSKQLEETHGKLTQSEVTLSETKDTLRCTQKLLTITANERDEESFLKNAHKATEQKLLEHGKQLISVADTTTSDIVQLHCKIDRKRAVEAENERLSADSSAYLKSETDRIRNNLKNILSKQANAVNDSNTKLGSIVEESDSNVQDMLSGFKDLSAFASSSLTGLTNCLINNEENQKNEVKKYLEKLSVDGTAIEKSCEQIFEQKITPYLTSLNLCLVSFDSLLLNLQEENAKKLTEIKTCCDTASEEQLSNIRLLDSKHESLLDVFRNHGDFHRQQLILLQQEEDKQIKALEEICEVALAAKASRQKKYNIYAEMKSMHEKAVVDSKEQSEKICETSGKMATAVPQKQTQIASIIEELHHLHNKVSSEYCDKSRTLQSECDEVCDKVELHGSKRVEDFSNLFKTASNFEANLCHIMSTAEVQESVETLSEKLAGDLSEKALILNDQQQSMDRQIYEICDGSLQASADANDSHCEQDQQLQKCIRRAISTKNLKRDVPTGNTPVSKEYPYSRILSETSPHQSLRSRFRGDTSITKVPVPESENEESFSNSARSSLCSGSESNSDAFLETNKLRRSGSFKEPPTFSLAKTTVIMEPKSFQLSRSSSVSCIGELKENKIDTKKRELRAPSTVTSYTTGRLKPRKILGPRN